MTAEIEKTSLPVLTAYAPLLISSQRAFLAKSTSICSRSISDTVLIASTRTPSSMFITVKVPRKMNITTRKAMIPLSAATSE